LRIEGALMHIVIHIFGYQDDIMIMS
jgi:hypothetical protein